MNTRRIQELRVLHKETQASLADKLGVQKRTYASWERNERDIPNDILVKIADLYNVSTDYLLGRTNSPTVNGYEEIKKPVNREGFLQTTQKDLGAQERKKSKDRALSVGEEYHRSTEELERFIRDIVRQELSEADFIGNDFAIGEYTTQAKMVARGGTEKRSFPISKTVAEAFENLPSDENQDGL